MHVNRLADLLGIELPIIQAPMAGAQGSALAIAVSNAGGLGSLPCALLGPEQVRQELGAIRAGTSRPFNVNFFCHVPPLPDGERERRWRSVLSRFGVELGVDVAAASSGPARLPFDADTARLLEEFAPRVVSFHFGLPDPDLVARLKRRGARILSSATTVDEARWLEARGADAVIAQGWEAGGHRGSFLSDDLSVQLGTFALVRQIAAAVTVPVIAAGGIADAEGVRAAMTLGAAGVQVGTAYLLCPEAGTSAVHRAALKSPVRTHTTVTNVFTGRPARGIVNRLIREIGPMSSDAPGFPLAAPAVTILRTRAEAEGSGDFSPLWAGQNTDGCREWPAADVTRDLARLLA